MGLGQLCEESPFLQQVFKHFLGMDGLRQLFLAPPCFRHYNVLQELQYIFPSFLNHFIAGFMVSEGL